MESRNAVFITDHGSMRVSRSRARRGPRPRAGAGALPGSGSGVGGGGGSTGGCAFARCSSTAELSFCWIRSVTGGRAAVSSPRGGAFAVLGGFGGFVGFGGDVGFVDGAGRSAVGRPFGGLLDG
jgi:hypothetical protein